MTMNEMKWLFGWVLGILAVVGVSIWLYLGGLSSCAESAAVRSAVIDCVRHAGELERCRENAVGIMCGE